MLVCIPVFFHVKVEFKTAFNFKNVIIMKEELLILSFTVSNIRNLYIILQINEQMSKMYNMAPIEFFEGKRQTICMEDIHLVH